ncbi:hypothetical protein [Saccharothrix hoggarensis]|uniref:YD repeat-containing protein n=1 Tax=Saccharothrix hoggarensis TaxID=913853 RepID=A0ABW3QTJ6_9PSEU
MPTSSPLSAPGAPVGFTDDPIASHSAQFGLARPIDAPAGHHSPSPVGARPWNLRAARTLTTGNARLGGWTYDHTLQVAVTSDGRRVTEVVAGDPTANSVTNLDGDEGASEDWTYDFHPDHTGDPA